MKSTKQLVSDKNKKTKTTAYKKDGVKMHDFLRV